MTAPNDAHVILGALDPDATAFTFQWFDDSPTKDKCLSGWRHSTLEELHPHLARMNDRGAGIFVMTNEGDGAGRSAANVVRARALLIDLDSAPLPTRWPIEPHVVVESSPDRYHAYWRVKGVPLEAFPWAQAFLAQCFGADPTVKDLPRVMRLPGYYHRKGEPYLVRILKRNDHPRYTLADFQQAYPGLAVALKPPRKPTFTRPPLAPMATEGAVKRLAAWGQAAAANVTTQGRHAALVQVAMKCYATGISKQEARTVMEATVAALPYRGNEPVPLSEALDTLEWAYAQQLDGRVLPLDDRPPNLTPTTQPGGGNYRLRRWQRLMGITK